MVSHDSSHCVLQLCSCFIDSEQLDTDCLTVWEKLFSQQQLFHFLVNIVQILNQDHFYYFLQIFSKQKFISVLQNCDQNVFKYKVQLFGLNCDHLNDALPDDGAFRSIEFTEECNFVY